MCTPSYCPDIVLVILKLYFNTAQNVDEKNIYTYG